jgi:hypothetical protein
LSSVLLTQAVSSGDEGAVSALLANGANVNERTSGGQTPLILATIFGHTHLLPLLLAAGADPHLRDNLGLNAIDWAQRRGAAEALRLFNNPQTPTPAPPRAETPERTEPPARPNSRDESERNQSVSEGEKSQRWLAGLKQRIAEQPPSEIPDGTNIFRTQPEPQVTQPASQVTQPESQVTQPETQVTQPEPQVTQREPAPGQKTEPPPPQIQASNATRAIDDIEPAPPITPKEDPAPKIVRKRCPKCGEIYNSEFVSYCAHHVVELVDADEPPIISEPPKSSPVLFWLIIVSTLVGSLIVGTLVTKYFFNTNSATPQSASGPTASPAPRAVQRGVPSLADTELERKATSLPIAECPLNGQEAIPGTVVVHIVINKDGRVTSARASGGDWLLRGAANEAAMKSTFSAEKLRGRETEGTITYNFEP